MKKIEFIQFDNSSEFYSDWGYYPTHNRLYRLKDLDDSYTVALYDEDDEEYEDERDAISIFTNNTNTLRSRKYVMKDNELSYGILTIELDDDSELFTERR